MLTLYRANVDGTGRVISRELISRNDDYFNSDSYIEMYLEPGTYYVGVSASGNLDYDPAIEDTGFGGRTQGNYQLRLNFRPAADETIVDADGHGAGRRRRRRAGRRLQLLVPCCHSVRTGGGGSSRRRSSWTRRHATTGGNGSLAAPFNRIPAALAVAQPNDIMRLVGNPGADGDITTLGDNVAYQIGFSRVGGAVLQDGATLEVPKGVTVMIDANAVLKLRRARIGVGSSAQGVDRSVGRVAGAGDTAHLRRCRQRASGRHGTTDRRAASTSRRCTTR